MWLILLTALAVAAPEAQVQTVGGETLAGSLTKLSADELVLATASGDRRLVTKEILNITLPAAAPAAVEPATVQIALTDHSRLSARSYRAAEGTAQVTLAGGETVNVPTRAIESVRFREHTGPLAEQWAEIVAAERNGDLLVVRKNEALDFHTGVVGDVTDETVAFDLDGETVRVKRTKVDGLLYHHVNEKVEAPAPCLVVARGGSEMRAASLALEGDRLRVRTPAGVEIAAPLEQIARIDFSGGNVQYLGDLKPESVTWTPYFGQASDAPATRELFRVRTDRGFDGGPLRLGGKQYAKGVAAHSRTELAYRLPDRFRTFQATAGIDDRRRPHGNVRLVIMGDDRKLWEETLTGQDAPRPLDLDIQGVNRLKFIVDFGGNADVGDVLDLCEARILK